MLGTDPEVFVLDTKGNPVPAWQFFPPKEQAIKGDNWSFFRDGYVLEFNVDADTCRARIGNRLRNAMQEATERLPRGYKLSTNASMQINFNDVVTAPPDGQVFGCNPSYNAYTRTETVPDLDAYNHLIRYAGAHFHFSGYSHNEFIKNDDTRMMFVKLCDLFIGLPLAYIFDGPDEIARRKYYGKAGEFRKTKYLGDLHGVEYRVPSPRVFNDYSLTSMFFGVMRTLQANYTELSKHWKMSWDKPIQNAINNCKVPFRMLQTASGFYTPELLRDIKKQRYFQDFVLPKTTVDNHTAFTEWARIQYGRVLNRDSENVENTYYEYMQKLGWKRYPRYYSPTGIVEITNPLRNEVK